MDPWQSHHQLEVIMNVDININTIPADQFNKYKLVDIREEQELINDPSLIKCPHVPLSALPEKLSFFNKEDTYLIFCHMGGRSHQLADYLSAQGYKTLSVNYGVGAVNQYVQTNAIS